MDATITEPAVPHRVDRVRRTAADVLRHRFRITTWPSHDDPAGIVTLTDPATGDTLTVAVLDTAEVSDPHILLTCTRDGVLCGHGPFDGDRRARIYAHALSRTDPTMALSRTVVLHHRELLGPATDAWTPLVAPLLLRARPESTGTPCGALVLRDPSSRLVAAIGPLGGPADADTWTSTIPLPPQVQRLYVGLRPADPRLAGA